MSADLIAFITARLAEDEQAARAVGVADVWQADSTWAAELLSPLPSQRRDHPGYIPMITQADLDHIARHDPARVLREVALKRRLLMLRANAAGAVAGAWEGTPGRNRIVDRAYLEAITDVLAEVATAWSEHPDYRQEWTP